MSRIQPGPSWGSQATEPKATWRGPEVVINACVVPDSMKATCSPGQERAKWGRRVSQPLVKRHFYPSRSESFWGCFLKMKKKKREESLRIQVMSKFHFRNIRNKQASFLKFSYCYNGVKKKLRLCGPQDFGWLVNACIPPSTPFKHHTKQTLRPHSQIHANTHSSNLL